MLTRTSLLLLPLGPALASAGLLSNVEHWLASSSERRAPLKCGVRGYADTDNNYFWSASKKLASRAACAARCGGDSRCESFGYDDRVCMLFDEALAGNFDADRRSDLTFYDAACPNANATAAAATTATASASTSSSSGRSRTTKTRTSTTAAAAMPTVTVPSSVAPPATSLTTSYTRAAASGATGGGAGLISLVANSSSVVDATSAAPSAASAQVEPSSASASVVESAAVTIVPVTIAVLNNNNDTSSSSSSSNATIPDGCDILASFTVTSLVWFDSADNLDCAHPNYANGSQVCWDAAQPQQLCDPTTTPDAATTCTCAPYCWPGTPAVARQPLGYGPPDTVSITLGGAAVGLAGGNGTCRQSNPPDAGTTQALLLEEVGDGTVDCGGATLDVLRFFGSSSSSSSGNGTATATVGRIEFSPPEVECGGRAAEYGASFALACETDAGGNATCTAAMPLMLSLTGFSS